MKEFIIFVCTDSAEIFFSKLRSAGLNYNLPKFFTDSYYGGGGGSNKHCLFTFFIIHVLESNLYKLTICEISIVWLVSVAEETDFSLVLSENPKTGFVALQPICYV